MADGPGKLQCQLTCFGAGGLLGLLAAVLLFFVGGFSSAQAIFCGILVAAVLGGVAALLFCKPLPTLEDAYAKNREEASRSGAAPTVAASAASAASSASAAPKPAAAATSAAAATAAPASAASAAAAAGEGAEHGSGDSAEEAMTGEPQPVGAAAFEDETGIATGSPEPVGAAALEDELVEAHADAELAAAEAADTAEPVADTAAEGEADAGEDYDRDGTLEGESEGTRPEALDGPRDGKADNLKEIKGIGPKLEKLCNAMGFYHFDQIANWTPDEVAWVNANLEGFKGRVTRDNWIEQARILAAGGETEFSKRVEGGDVY